MLFSEAPPESTTITRADFCRSGSAVRQHQSGPKKTCGTAFSIGQPIGRRMIVAQNIMPIVATIMPAHHPINENHIKDFIVFLFLPGPSVSLPSPTFRFLPASLPDAPHLTVANLDDEGLAAGKALFPRASGPLAVIMGVRAGAAAMRANDCDLRHGFLLLLVSGNPLLATGPSAGGKRCVSIIPKIPLGQPAQPEKSEYFLRRDGHDPRKWL